MMWRALTLLLVSKVSSNFHIERKEADEGRMGRSHWKASTKKQLRCGHGASSRRCDLRKDEYPAVIDDVRLIQSRL